MRKSRVTIFCVRHAHIGKGIVHEVAAVVSEQLQVRELAAPKERSPHWRAWPRAWLTRSNIVCCRSVGAHAGFPVLTHFYFLPATNFSISSRSLMSVASRCTLRWAAAAAYCVSLGGERLTREITLGTGRYCRLPDGRVENEWHLYRTERLDND